MLGAFSALKITYNISQQGEPRITDIQYYTKTNDKLFVVMYTAKPNAFKVFLPTVKWMVSSFRCEPGIFRDVRIKVFHDYELGLYCE